MAQPRSGPGVSPALVPGDLVRAAILVSVVVGLAWSGFVAGALFFLVLGGATLCRALAVPTGLDVACCTTMLLAAWAAELDWYVSVPWLDLVAHALATGLIAALAHLTLVRLGLLPAVDAGGEAGAEAGGGGLRHPRLGAAAVTAALGVALATVWEFGEWFGHTALDDRIQVGYTDTVSDLAAGTLGAVVAGVLVARGILLAGRRP